MPGVFDDVAARGYAREQIDYWRKQERISAAHAVTDLGLAADGSETWAQVEMIITTWIRSGRISARRDNLPARVEIIDGKIERTEHDGGR